MLTYHLKKSKLPLYEQLYLLIKSDILNKKLNFNDKLPSKRNLATNLGISIITIQNAYNQLLNEGLIYSVYKKGYFVDNIEFMITKKETKQENFIIKKHNKNLIDLSLENTKIDYFPFSIWANLMRKTLMNSKIINQCIPSNGLYELRDAISLHLRDFHGLDISPELIVIGAGSEYLYMILVKIFGKNSVFALENPGFTKIGKIYKNTFAKCDFIDIDELGMSIDGLNNSKANIAHITSQNHFPTNITMPISRRLEIIKWANFKKNRYIIEDEYFSEFTPSNKNISTLKDLDQNKVIYMNTFSKTLMPNLRISYMILPPKLMEIFIKKLSFFASPISVLEQYTLANFIKNGYFERHINRLRRKFRKNKDEILEILTDKKFTDKFKILNKSSQTHFILYLNQNISQEILQKKAKKLGYKISFLEEYFYNKKSDFSNIIINFSNSNSDEILKFCELFFKEI